MSGNNRSHSVRATRRVWNVNLQKYKVNINGKMVEVKMSARAYRSLNKSTKAAAKVEAPKAEVKPVVVEEAPKAEVKAEEVKEAKEEVKKEAAPKKAAAPKAKKAAAKKEEK
jgi:large subunit ribosomal protein L28